jgi:hypothetical protein
VPELPEKSIGQAPLEGDNMIPFRALLMLLAIVCLFLAALNVQPPRGNLMAAGLTLWAIAVTLA